MLLERFATSAKNVVNVSTSNTFKEAVSEKVLYSRICLKSFHAKVLAVVLVKCGVPEIAGIAEPVKRSEEFEALIWTKFKLRRRITNEDLAGKGLR